MEVCEVPTVYPRDELWDCHSAAGQPESCRNIAADCPVTEN